MHLLRLKNMAKTNKSEKKVPKKCENTHKIVKKIPCFGQLSRGVYSTRVSFALPPPRTKSLGMLPHFYFNKKGHFCPKSGQLLPWFEIVWSNIPFLTFIFLIFPLFSPFSYNFFLPLLVAALFCLFCLPAAPPLGERGVG